VILDNLQVSVTVHDKSNTGKSLAVFVDFQQTAKVFPTNFINLYKAKHVLSKTVKVFPAL